MIQIKPRMLPFPLPAAKKEGSTTGKPCRKD